MSKITGKEYPISKIFSSDFDYRIPEYQRPYAWTEEEAGTLFDDLYDFYQAQKNDHYFLGSIVLIQSDGEANAEVVDGQQRLTTLTILIAVIASQLPQEAKSDCEVFLREKGNRVVGLPPKPRLHLRQIDQELFEKYIQNVNLAVLFEMDKNRMKTEAQQHIQANCRVLVDKVEEQFADDADALQDFCTFLLNRCFLVTVSTDSKESAFRVFSVMNSRGLDLLPIDIIKSNVIGQIPEQERQIYTDKWEQLENQTTRSGFNEVFAHTRTIFAKAKAKKGLYEEFETYVMKNRNPKALMDEVIEPYAEAYTVLKSAEYRAESKEEEINDLLSWLNRIDNADWMPPAIRFLAERQNDPEYVLWFIKRLECLAAYLHLSAQSINNRMERYRRVLEEMERNPEHSLDNPLKSVELTNVEKQRFIQVLDGEAYQMTPRRRNYLILRLDSFVSCGGAKYDAKVFTIEHVLPQTVSSGSEWERNWPDMKLRLYWLDRIANLVPLTRRHNSSAQNFDFERKKSVYFKGKNGTVSYTLTTQVIACNSWTPDIVEQRQRDLMEILIQNWRLDIEDNGADVTYYLNLRGCMAEGYARNDDTFVVKKGSKIAASVTNSIQSSYINFREKLKEDKVIVDDKFVQDYSFSSASAAASVVSGRSANGRQEWVAVDGRSYGEVIDQSLQE